MSGFSESTIVFSSSPLTVQTAGGSTAQNQPTAARAPVAPLFQLDQQFRPTYNAVGEASVYTSVGSPPPFYRPGQSGNVAIHNNLNTGEKRKRGRPRKYCTAGDGSTSAGLSLGQQSGFLLPPPESATASHQGEPFASPPPPPQQQQSQLSSGGPAVPKARGRPRGSTNKQKAKSSRKTGAGVSIHLIKVNRGEDLFAQIMAFSQRCSRAVSIMSVSGAITSATLHQPASSGGTITYEGQYDILTLSGAFLPSEGSGQRSRTGGLSITMAGADGKILGGCVAGALIAASLIQVIVTCFKPSEGEEPSLAPQGSAAGASSSPSAGGFSGSSGGHMSPLNHNVEPYYPQMADIGWD